MVEAPSQEETDEICERLHLVVETALAKSDSGPGSGGH
jgi:hypothetical protein